MLVAEAISGGKLDLIFSNCDVSDNGTLDNENKLANIQPFFCLAAVV